ncbi:protein myomixer-like [Conger conger]|uniref:protein myomixer-like n=1 Tax=Conger conger TaxID=82655 RepID=UPI002A59C796|nr:protein myomixer-like [Conger conger]
MPAVLLVLRALLVRLLGSRLAAAAARLLRGGLSLAAARLGALLRHVWERVRSREAREAVLSCVLCLLNLHKKADN